jgi:hypothetical protein
VVGDNNFVVNNNHGTIVRQEALPIQRRSLSPKPPPKSDGFIGRKRELAQVEDWIAQNKVVIVQGADGIGKTSLIKQAANGQSAKSQPDGIVFVDALDEEGKLLEFADLVQRIFDALFESQPHEKVDLSSARTHLSNTQPLVLLNAIALTPQNLSQLQNLFSEAPIVIATESPALTRGRPTSLSLGPLDREDSLALLASLTSVNDQETLSQIATLLENVPAALSIVADTIRTDLLSLDEVLERLRAYTPREGIKAKAAVERAFQLLYSTLSEDEREMLDQVAAAFGVSVDRKWLESVCGGNAVSDKLESLGLLHANSPRLRLMSGLKPLLLQARDVSKQRERLLNHLLSELKTRWNDFEFIKDELGNLLGLLFWSAAQGHWANVIKLGRAIDPYLTLSGHWEAWRKTLGEIQRAAQALQDLALKGWVLHQLGTYEIGMGNLAAARKLLEEAISTRNKLGDEIGVAFSQNNLQLVAPVAMPANRPGNLTSWLLGGALVVAIVAFLIFNNPRANQTPPTAEPVLAPGEVNIIVSPSETPTSTSTLTQTASPSAAATLTTAPTLTLTPSPTFAIQSKIVVNDLAPAPCFYGPSNVYLNKGTRRIAGNEVDLLGRIETDKGIWVHNRFSPPRTDASDPCWMDSKYLDITEEQLMSVPPVDPSNPNEYKLPIDYFSTTILKDPVVTGVNRTGDTVTVSWEFFDVGEGQYPNHNENFYRYLIEAWLCKDGKIVFSPSGWGPYGPEVTDGVWVTAQLQDESACTEPSHARIYLAWAHGYAGPAEIEPWFQSETGLPTPTP